MKNFTFFKKKLNSIITLFLLIGTGLLFFNCSDLYMNDWDCVEANGRECGQNGNINWLNKKPVDVLVVMDTSARARKLNTSIASNLNQFLTCVQPLDWRIGVVSGMDKTGSNYKTGELMNIEGAESRRFFVNTKVKNYQEAFSKTVSFSTGCSNPPYCGKGSLKPLTAVQAFMEKEEQTPDKNRFLRSYADLAVILISTKDEKKKIFSQTSPSEAALSAVYKKYSEDDIIGFTVTDSGGKKACVKTMGNTMWKGANTIGRGGMAYGMLAFNPVVFLGSQLVKDFSEKQPMKNTEKRQIVQFAKITGGYAFDICKPHFGTAIAYSLLKKTGLEESFADECKKHSIKTKTDTQLARKNSSRQTSSQKTSSRK